jgi:hypothetical protein
MKEGMTEFVEKLEDLVKKASIIENPTVVIGKKEYWLKDQKEVSPEIHQKNLTVNSMQALADYIEYGCEGIAKDKLFIHVVSPERIELYQKVTDEKIRPCLMSVIIDPEFESFRFGQYMESEDFTIGLQSLFEESNDLPKALIKASSICAQVAIKKDDKHGATNMSVSNEIKSGDDEIVFNLRPYRTFREIKQPLSTFVFRIQAKSLDCKLVAADGGSWRIKARDEIKKWLSEKIKEVTILG